MASRASEAGGEAQNRFSLTAQNSKTFVGLVNGYSRNKIRSKQFTWDITFRNERGIFLLLLLLLFSDSWEVTPQNWGQKWDHMPQPTIPTPNRYHLNHTEKTRNTQWPPSLDLGPTKCPHMMLQLGFGALGNLSPSAKAQLYLPDLPETKTSSAFQWNRAWTHPFWEASPSTAREPSTHLSPLI